MTTSVSRHLNEFMIVESEIFEQIKTTTSYKKLKINQKKRRKEEMNCWRKNL